MRSRGGPPVAAGSVAVAAAITALALLAPSASARTANDPCNDSANAKRLHCQRVEEIPAARTVMVPDDPFVACGPRTKMAGTKVSDADHYIFDFNAYTAEWDFWSNRGEWVAWGGLGTFEDRRVVHLFHVRYIAKIYRPLLHNWWLAPWPIRVFHRCDEGLTSERPVSAREDVPRSEPVDLPPPSEGSIDTEVGDGASDQELGGTGGDLLIGAGGDDTERGGPGDDQLLSGPGDDFSNGGHGSDELFDDQGRDKLVGGDGNDRFSAHDGDHDVIHCGEGEDVVVADHRDTVSDNCEHVFLSAEHAPAMPPKN